MTEIRKTRRLVIVCPMRSHTKTVEMIFSNGEIPETYLRQKHGKELDELATLERTFGIVAGTGVGKTVFLRDIAIAQFGKDFTYSVVTSEEQATEKTWEANVLVATSGVTMNYLKAGYIGDEDVIIIDEIHQTSVHLELVLALARRKGIRVNFMSATIDPQIYVDYFNTETILHCAERDPEKRANVEVIKFAYGKYDEGIKVERDTSWIEYVFDYNYGGLMDKVIANRLGAAVFLPTREMCEKFSAKYNNYAEKLYTDFYHGGEKAEKLKKFIKGEVPRPFVIFMTPAGASSLNIAGLDVVIMQDEIYKEVSEFGVRSLTRTFLDNNDILQMAGRVDGRVKDGCVIIMSSRYVNYEELRPETPNFVLSGDPETLALTCSHQEIDLSELDPIGGVNRAEYKKAWDMLVERELITPDNKLTEYGEQVHRLPVSRPWGEYLVNARGDPLFNVIMICSASPSLYSFLKKNSYNLTGLNVPGNDYLTKYNIIKLAIEQYSKIWKDNETGEVTLRLSKEFYPWAKERGIYGKTVDNALIAISAICRNLNILLPELKSRLLAVDEKLEKKFKSFMLEIDAFEVCNQSGRTGSNQLIQTSESSMCHRQLGPYYGQINVIRTAKGEHVNIFEGFCLDKYDALPFVDSKRSGGISLSSNGETSVITWHCSGFCFEEFITIKVEYEQLPEPYAHDQYEIENAEKIFIEYVACNSFRLSDDICEQNEAIIERIAVNRRKSGKYCDSLEAGLLCYGKILRGSGIYNLSIAKAKGFSFKLEEKDFEEELKEPEIKPIESKPYRYKGGDGYTAVTANDYVAPQERFTNAPRLTIRADQRNRMPEQIHKYNRAGKKNESYAEIFPYMRVEKPAVKKPRIEQAAEVKPAEPKGKTQERVDWLVAQEELVRADIRKLLETKQQLTAKAEALGEKYNELFRQKKDTWETQDAWRKACEEIEKIDTHIAEIKSKAERYSDEALEIMELIEIN